MKKNPWFWAAWELTPEHPSAFGTFDRKPDHKIAIDSLDMRQGEDAILAFEKRIADENPGKRFAFGGFVYNGSCANDTNGK